jgi:hypothetical protein
VFSTTAGNISCELGSMYPGDVSFSTAHITTTSDESSTANNMPSASFTAEDTDNFTPVPEPPPVKPTPNSPIAMSEHRRQ